MTDTHIKIKPVTPRVQYTANGSTTVFPYSFAIFDETDMVVYVDDEIITTGYTVSGAGETDGGAVTFSVAPEDGKKITLLRNVPIERMTDFQEGGTFRPKNINDEFDRQTAFMQQVQEKVDRTLILPPTTDIDPSQILGEVERIYDSIDNVDAVADNETNVNAVAEDLTNIDAVAGNENNINTVAGILSDVSAVAGNAADVSNVATNMSDVNDCATNMSAIQDAPNQAQAAADSAALAQQYGNDKINQTHITNCITYIPQDIKLELNNGTLTLKAGSKVYVPNGAGVFDEITTSSDLTWTGGWGSTQFFVYVAPNNTLAIREISLTESGSSSTLTSQYRCWYDTTNNRVKWTDDYGNNWTDGFSFPVALMTCDASSIISIDKVFNGFGYIGSTVFALPGVKGLIPNGRNEDGTLKNIVLSNQNVATFTWSPGLYGENFPVIIETNAITFLGNTNTFMGGERPTNPSAYTRWYNTEENYWEDYTTSWNKVSFCLCGNVNLYDGKVTSFSPKTVLRALDFNDKGFISEFSMPSRKGIQLNIGASNSAYTAPANGWFCLNVVMNGSNTWVRLYNDTSSYMKAFQWCSSEKQETGIFLPVRKGDVVYLSYNTTISYESWTTGFSFIFAQGEV